MVAVEMKLETGASLEAPRLEKLAELDWLLCHSEGPECYSSACLTACEWKDCLWWLLSSCILRSGKACNHKCKFLLWQAEDVAGQ